MKKVALAAGIAAIAALALPAVSSARLSIFHTPSKKVYCAFFSGSSVILRCDTKYRIAPLGSFRCREGDWGNSINMSARSKAHGLCAGDTVIGSRGPALAYGTTKHYGPFTCTSRTSGLTCSNRVGHGWFLSDTKQRKF